MSQNHPLNPNPPNPPCQGGTLKAPSHDKGRAGEGLSLTFAGEERAFETTFLPYNKNLTALARKNRSNPTKAESKIWQEVLRMRQFSKYKFLRQKPIGGYIVDFYCAELGMVIEIDGDSHAEAVEYDEVRTNLLNSLGLRVIRYANDDVLRNVEGVYEDLNRQLHETRFSLRAARGPKGNRNVVLNC